MPGDAKAARLKVLPEDNRHQYSRFSNFRLNWYGGCVGLAACLLRLIDDSDDGNAGLGQDVSDLGLPQARGVVFEGEMIFLLIDAEAAQAVGVGKFSETPELFEAEGRLQFVGNLDECHGESIAGGVTAVS